MFDQIALALAVPVLAYLVLRVFVGPKIFGGYHPVAEAHWERRDKIAGAAFLLMAICFFLGSFW